MKPTTVESHAGAPAFFIRWCQIAEQRARDYHAECRARSQARRAAGAPSLAELIAAYQSLAPVESGPPSDQLSDDELMMAVQEETRAEDELRAIIEEEITASATLQECVEQATDFWLRAATRQLLILPLPLN
jgi:hypothetical protein